MPRVDHILNDCADVEIPHGDDVLHVSYRPSVLTQRLGEQIEAGHFAGPLSKLLISWDLLDDDGVPYELDEEALKDVPTGAMVFVGQAILKDMGPKLMRPETSAAGSSAVTTASTPSRKASSARTGTR